MYATYDSNHYFCYGRMVETRKTAVYFLQHGLREQVTPTETTII